MDTVLAEPCELDALIREAYNAQQPTIGWLGQAGFLIRCAPLQLVIDPYLSDSLAAKYRGAAFPHIRLIPPPIAPEHLTNLHAVLCTHAHTDHMDPETLSPIAAASPQCRFVVPRRAADGHRPGRAGGAFDRDECRRAGALGGGPVGAGPACRPRAAADGRSGQSPLPGLSVALGEFAIYHAGDCVPFDGLEEDLAACQVELAILPVNGRDEARRSQGVPGNFTFDEAAALCIRCGIPAMMPCHFGMFDFNTVAESWLDEQISRLPRSFQCVRPRPGYAYRLAPRTAGPTTPAH